MVLQKERIKNKHKSIDFQINIHVVKLQNDIYIRKNNQGDDRTFFQSFYLLH